MSLTKHKKIIVGLAAVAVMSLGGVTASAATAEPTLTPAGPLDLTKVEIKEGTFTVVEGVTPHIAGGKTAKTAPGAALTAVSGSVDFKNAEAGTVRAGGPLSPQIIGGQESGHYTTAAAR